MLANKFDESYKNSNSLIACQKSNMLSIYQLSSHVKKDSTSEEREGGLGCHKNKTYNRSFFKARSHHCK